LELLAAGIWPLAEIREAINLVFQKKYYIKHVDLYITNYLRKSLVDSNEIEGQEQIANGQELASI
jgi:hypothetical protein